MATVFFSESVLDRSIDSVRAKCSYTTSSDETFQIFNSLRQRGVQVGLIDYSGRFKEASDLKLTTFSSFSEARNIKSERNFFVGQDSSERAGALKAGFCCRHSAPTARFRGSGRS